MGNCEKIVRLATRGARLLLPESVYIAPEVELERIAPDVTIYPGCRLEGATLSIGPGAVLGAEAPVTVRDCQLGAGVKLAGGCFERATMLDGFSAGSGSHVRPGSLLEEASSIAHCVGLKQTILMPWVTIGSLVNFCDVLMAGGGGCDNHSEVGSSYVHFNFTPRQDKATASLIGDVPSGVLLDQPPIFLGGQGGLVGPATIAYGTVLAAGQVWRGDVLKPGRLLAPPDFGRAIDTPADIRRFPSLRRVLQANCRYLGNLVALDLWYRQVRARFMRDSPFQAACHAGALERLSEALAERLRRLDELAAKARRALEREGPLSDERHLFTDAWPGRRERIRALAAALTASEAPPDVRVIIASLPQREGYLKAIQALPAASADTLRRWLNSIVASIAAAGIHMPS